MSVRWLDAGTTAGRRSLKILQRERNESVFSTAGIRDGIAGQTSLRADQQMPGRETPAAVNPGLIRTKRQESFASQMTEDFAAMHCSSWSPIIKSAGLDDDETGKWKNGILILRQASLGIDSAKKPGLLKRARKSSRQGCGFW